MRMQNIIRDKRYRVADHRLTPFTIALIGKAIRDGSSYLPIRNHAAALAATAPRKNYLLQLKAIYDDFVRRWRYVKDPVGVETVTINPRAMYNLVWGFNGGLGRGIGGGDCDDAAAALGAATAAVGAMTRIAVIAPPGYPGLGFTHVFIQCLVPGRGWISLDPVLEPHKGFGDTAPHGRMAIWDLKGNLIATRGVSPSALKKAYKMQGGKNVKRHRLPRRRY